MAGIISFILRAAFLTFFALNAWNNIKDLKSFHPAFTKSYQNFEKSLTSKTGLKFPHFISSTQIEQNSELVSKTLVWTQFSLSAAALFLSYSFTSLVGFLYLLTTIIQLNAAKISMRTKLTDLEPIVLAIGLFAASLTLSCCGAKVKSRATIKKSNDNVRTEPQAKNSANTEKRK